MHSLQLSPLLPSVLTFLSLFSCAISTTINQQFFRCLKVESDVIFTPTSPSYKPILESRIQNLRFNTTETPKPLAIITPLDVSQVQATIICSRRHNLQITIRSGGHDFEGLSFASPLPFVMLDLINFRNITVDVEDRVAWVEPAATLGELYYRIGEKSRTLAFPAGACPTVGIGGHFSGGGYGFLLRKYGLAADNIVDALLVDVNGRVLDRASMGEDLFWAIRGGGGNTFGVVISWKVNLVSVPPTVTYCRVAKTLEQNATQLLHRWQFVASKLPDDITLTPFFNRDSAKTFSFDSLYLGRIVSLLPLMEKRFPELGLKREDCREVSWVESILPLILYPSNTSLDVLLKKNNTRKGYIKFKSDYVKKPIPETALEGLVKWFSSEENKDSYFYMIPYGGKMGDIAETSIPFPHRAGNIYKLGYAASWKEEGREAADKYINWIRNVYSYMTPYVSKNPREAYVNYRDLDIGTNNPSGNTTYKQASIWGKKYFKCNFDRLVGVKTKTDPSNFFRNEQSIPPLSLELPTFIRKTLPIVE